MSDLKQIIAFQCTEAIYLFQLPSGEWQVQIGDSKSDKQFDTLEGALHELATWRSVPYSHLPPPGRVTETLAGLRAERDAWRARFQHECQEHREALKQLRQLAGGVQGENSEPAPKWMQDILEALPSYVGEPMDIVGDWIRKSLGEAKQRGDLHSYILEEGQAGSFNLQTMETTPTSCVVTNWTLSARPPATPTQQPTDPQWLQDIRSALQSHVGESKDQVQAWLRERLDEATRRQDVYAYTLTDASPGAFKLRVRTTPGISSERWYTLTVAEPTPTQDTSESIGWLGLCGLVERIERGDALATIEGVLHEVGGMLDLGVPTQEVVLQNLRQACELRLAAQMCGDPEMAVSFEQEAQGKLQWVRSVGKS